MSTWSREEMLAAARAIRPYLEALSEDHQARDAELAAILQEASAGSDVDLQLVDALTATAALRRWTEEFVRAQRPPQVTRTRAGIELTMSGPVDFERWVCPHGDFDWFRFAPDERVRPCPTHRVALVRPPAKKD